MEEITYTEVNGYLIPDLILPDEKEYEIGKYGRMRKNFLKSNRKGFYSSLLTTGKLHEHLYEIDQTANDRLQLITTQFAKAEGVTEELKANSQMEWIGRMTNIHNRAEEIIKEELIYA